MWLSTVLGVCVFAPVREFFCLLWRETHTKSLSLRSPTSPEVEEERKVRKKTEFSWQRTTERCSRQRSPVGGAVSRRRQWGKTVKNELSFIVGFVEVSRKIHVCDSLQIHGEYKVSQNSLSCAWSWPKSVFVRLFFFSLPLGCILCGHKELCDITAETTRWITGHE